MGETDTGGVYGAIGGLIGAIGGIFSSSLQSKTNYIQMMTQSKIMENEMINQGLASSEYEMRKSIAKEQQLYYLKIAAFIILPIIIIAVFMRIQKRKQLI